MVFLVLVINAWERNCNKTDNAAWDRQKCDKWHKKISACSLSNWCHTQSTENCELLCQTLWADSGLSSEVGSHWDQGDPGGKEGGTTGIAVCGILECTFGLISRSVNCNFVQSQRLLHCILFSLNQGLHLSAEHCHCWSCSPLRSLPGCCSDE